MARVGFLALLVFFVGLFVVFSPDPPALSAPGHRHAAVHPKPLSARTLHVLKIRDTEVLKRRHASRNYNRRLAHLRHVQKLHREQVQRERARRAAAPSYERPTSDLKRYALDRVGEIQFRCLDALWTLESGWQVHDMNGHSGAYGIPQALPGSKMASAGSDWQDNGYTQIRWGLSYIAARYGTPCGAWAHSQADGWY